MKIIKKILKVLCGILLVVILYICISLIHGTVTDFKPAKEIPLKIAQASTSKIISDNTLTFIAWNVGYGGLGKESEFFYDSGGFLTSNGKMVRAHKEHVEKNINGIVDFLAKNKDVDFFLLQEVDVNSKRSYKINQYARYQNTLENYSSSFAVNYRAPRVPLPVLEPWNVMGKMESGLGTFSKYTPTKATRYQLPGEYAWPDRVFHLDRCAAFHRYDLKNGKELIVVNIHNSAYDSGGFLKKSQMDFLKNKFKSEYAKGNYLVIGGDWNQRPFGITHTDFGGTKLKSAKGKVVPENYFKDWQWVYDINTPTNRALAAPYKKGETKVNIIDFFLVSPNLSVKKVDGINMDFEYSDHQPVWMEVELISTNINRETIDTQL